ncbi:hypothetical protein [Nonomuraea dietziae]|uniref:hypothetical protein n=1 Tax=Nonomuraea dietziae TaxID=65515 RepID=UPI0031D3804C
MLSSPPCCWAGRQCHRPRLHGARGVVFRDSFSSSAETCEAWSAVHGSWVVTYGVYGQQDTTRTGWKAVADDLVIVDGLVEATLAFRALATSTAFGGVQVLTAKPETPTRTPVT